MTEKTSGKLLRFVAGAFAAAVLAFLALSGAVTLLHRSADTSYYENRTLAALPAVTKQGVLDGSWFSSLNTYLRERTAGRTTLLRAQTLLDLYLLRRPVVNGVVVGDGVLLPMTDYWTYDRDALARQAEETAERIAAHARTAEQYGGRFYYVAVPHQALAYLDAFPAYLQTHEDYYLDVESLLFPALDARGVEWLDMWAELRASGLLQTVSSRVDNHFNLLGAQETCRRLASRIEADTGYHAAAMAGEDVRIEWLPNHYLGSRMRKLFDLWPSDEKLGVAVSDAAPDYVRSDRAAWMTEARVGAPIYALPDSADAPVTYDLYMGGDWGETAVETGRPEKPSVLIYGDSFTNGVECIAWMDFDTMWSFDFRHYDAQTLDALIARLQPDFVVCVRDYEALMSVVGNGQ